MSEKYKESWIIIIINGSNAKMVLVFTQRRLLLFGGGNISIDVPIYGYGKRQNTWENARVKMFRKRYPYKLAVNKKTLRMLRTCQATSMKMLYKLLYHQV